MGFDRMSKGAVGVDSVVVPSSVPRTGQISGFTEFGDDPLNGPFRDSYAGGDVPGPNRRVLVNADEDMGVVGEKGPIAAQPIPSFLCAGGRMRRLPSPGETLSENGSSRGRH